MLRLLRIIIFLTKVLYHFANYSNTLTDITTSQSWNNETIINNNISVESPATLTINNTTYLNQNTVFDVKNGGNLTVSSSGSILGGCNAANVWKGTLIFEAGATVTINAW